MRFDECFSEGLVDDVDGCDGQKAADEEDSSAAAFGGLGLLSSLTW